MSRWVILGLVLSLAACASAGNRTSGRAIGSIERKDPRFDALIPPGAQMEVLAGGFDWTEGPLWIKDGGFLIFSVIPPNKILK
ncbi:MAG TPA: SMP-30/gluconolactonase/LRE family protein, partial [Planctomycetota bacterium]|nr:SMP-30/gluconolactonase/LRE family protein [Planctomycetota bacterium]